MTERYTVTWLPSYRLFKETLERMCRWTTPHGHEDMMIPMLPCPPHGMAPGAGPAYLEAAFHRCDETGNYWVVIPGQGDDVMWTSHLDTVGHKPEAVTLVTDGDTLRSDGSTILGADDKVGVAIMCMMIRAGVPGTYAFFTGEEVGCIGSRAAAKELASRMSGKKGSVTHADVGKPFRACISLDRKGTQDVITHQMGSRCCSDAWASALADSINRYICNGADYRPDDGGVFTDSAQYTDVIDQCTNLSVGYYDQHGNSERVNMRHAYDLALALIRLCRAEGIPDIKRDRDAEELEDRDNYGSLYGGCTGYDWLKYHGGGKRWWRASKRNLPPVPQKQEDDDCEAIEFLKDFCLPYECGSTMLWYDQEDDQWYDDKGRKITESDVDRLEREHGHPRFEDIEDTDEIIPI